MNVQWFMVSRGMPKQWRKMVHELSKVRPERLIIKSDIVKPKTIVYNGVRVEYTGP